MNIAKTILAAAVAATAFSAPALAQDAEFQLPSSARQQPPRAAWTTRPWTREHGWQSGRRMMEMMGMGGMDLESMPEHVQRTCAR